MRKNHKRLRTVQQGMTLVEIMVVVAIIGVIMGAVAIGAIPMLNKANCRTAWAETQNISQAVHIYQTENNGDCPKGIDDLVSGKFLTKAPTDPWGQPFNFKCPGDKASDGADIWSKGRDKIEGSEDDIKSWGKQEEQCKK